MELLTHTKLQANVYSKCTYLIGLPRKIWIIYEKVLKNIETQNKQINIEEFINISESFFEDLTVLEKNILMDFGKQSKKENNASFSFNVRKLI